MNRIRCIIVTMSLAATPQLLAQVPIYLGSGTVKCSQVVQDFDKNKQTEVVYWTWAQGYMSGVNRVLDESKAGPRNLATARSAPLLAYCRQHPTEFFAQAVDKIFAGLPLVKRP